MYGAVDGDAEGDAEYEDGGGLDGDAEVSHESGGEELREDVGEHGDEHHAFAFECPGHEEGDEGDGEGEGDEEVFDEVSGAAEVDDAGAGDFDAVLVSGEVSFGDAVDGGFFFLHFDGAYVFDAEAEPDALHGSVDE